MNIDFGKTATDYAKHRAGFPDSLFERLAPFDIGLAGQTIVDIGTGTGTLARGFAQRGCHVTGIDPAEALMAQARALDSAAGVHVTYRTGTAEATGLPDVCTDVVSAGQCWHWFDRPAAAREVARILRPDGKLVIAHFDWLPLQGNVVEATEQLILKHNPAWHLGGGTGVYPEWPRAIGEAGFRHIEIFTYDVDVPYTHEDWRGRIRASAGVAASLSAAGVAVFDEELALLLTAQFPADPLSIPHRVFALIADAPLASLYRCSDKHFP